MEHIVQFAIGIDDEVIAENIRKNAEKTITENLEKRVMKSIFMTDYWGRPIGSLSSAAETLFLNWLDSHKDEIIQIASKALAEKMIKTKAVKTAIANVLEGDV